MYCIISLPRTASTFTWHQIHAGLVFLDFKNRSPFSSSIFNPRYNTPEQIQKKYEKVIVDLPLIKIISNHSWDMVENILNSKYQTIFIKPKDVRRYVLKNVVAKQTDSYANKEARYPYVGTLVITEQEIQERLEYYYKHMNFESRCNYSFYDLDILNNPFIINETINLPIVKNQYSYRPSKYSDEEMLQDVNQFNQLFESVYERQR